MDMKVLRKSCGRVLNALVMSAMAGASWAYDAEYTAGQEVTISKGGSYLVTGSGSGKVTIAENIGSVELTLRDVSWTGGGNQIDIKPSSSVSLVLEGTSTITHSAWDSAVAIKLPQSSSVVVGGTGTLNINTFGHSCIGVQAGETMGSLTMNSGTVVAHAGGKGDTHGLSAAIGGTYGNPYKGGNGGTVVVNGGTLIAAGYSAAPGIGGGAGYGAGGGGDAGSLTVNGGHVIACSYLSGSYGDSQPSCAIGPGRSRQDIAYNGKAGRIVVTGGILEAWVEMPGSSCFGQARGAGKAATNPADAGLFVSGGTVKWNHLLKDEADFAYSFANCTVGCANGLEFKPVGLWLPVNTDLAALFPAGVNFEKAPGETVAANSLRLYDLAAGDLVLSETSPFTLVGASASTANKIVASAGTTVEAAVCGVQSTGGWEVPAGTQVTFWVYGSNTVDFNGVCCKLPATGTLRLKGTGSWTFTSSNSSLSSAIGLGANAGDWGTLEVDGPAITAHGSDRAAGVGGSYGYQGRGAGGGVVTVRSGSLTAYGYGGSAGIGGGSPYKAACGSGPQVTVYTNGTLYAYNMAGNRGGPNKFDGCGVAIGAGRPLMDSATSFAASNAGTIVVDGGTVYASAGNRGVSSFGCPLNNSNGSFSQNPNATGSLTVKNGGKVFFRHSTFPDKYAVTIDNGTLSTMSDSPAETWVTFNGLATVTNALTIAGPVAPVLETLPSFKNNPAFNLETGVTLMNGMLPGEWIEVAGEDEQKITLSTSLIKRTKVEGERTLTRYEAREGWVNLAELNAVYEITTNGVYKFYGKGASSVAIRVAANVVCTNVFGDVSLAVNGGSVAPLELGAGSQVFLQLMGANTMNRNGTEKYAVIRVPDGAALTIADGAEEGEATGSLTIDQSGISVSHVVGIGEVGVDAKMGSLTIDSGNVVIKMRHDNNAHGGAAIGSALQGSSCGTVTINGGRVELDGPGLGPAIGAGTDNTRMGHGGNVTINGGYVIAHGYSGASAIGLAPTYASGGVGTPGSFTMNGGTLFARAFKGGSYGSTQCGAAIGGSGTRNGTSGATIGQVTINGGNLYLYSEGAYSIGCGRPQNTNEPVARAATDRVVINGGNVWAEQGIQGEVVNAAGQVAKQVSIPSSHFSEYPCTLTLDDATAYTFPKTIFSDGLEHLWLPPSSCEPEANLAIVVGGSDDETASAYTLANGDAKVYVAGKTSLSSASALTGAGVIVLSDGSETTFDGLDFTTTSGNGYHATVVLENQAEAKIVLKGANALKRIAPGDSVIHLPDGAKLTIDGGTDDWLRIDQRSSSAAKNDMAGIGLGTYDKSTSMGTFVLNGGNVEVQMDPANCYAVAVGVMGGNRNAGTVIVNGGTLLAASGALCAGIGGGYSYEGYASNGGTVIVNGGVVTAKGYGGAAGIGGAAVYNGVVGRGGSFTLNGGTVYAYAYKTGGWASGRCGAAIGGAAQRDADKVGGMGTVTINDGTLHAYSDLGAAIGHGNTVSGNCTIANGSDGAFAIKGGSVRLKSGNGGILSHVAPKNGDLALPLVTMSARRFGAPPYALEFVQRKVTGGAEPLVYAYHGAGYEDDSNLYLYLPYGNYLVNGRSCSIDENGIAFPGFLMIVR